MGASGSAAKGSRDAQASKIANFQDAQASKIEMEFRLSKFGPKELKSFCASQGVDIGGCIEKNDLLQKASSVPASKVTLRLVRRDIAKALQARNHDDGSYGPLLLRFAWHK
jgi:hypothetical protein